MKSLRTAPLLPVVFGALFLMLLWRSGSLTARPETGAGFGLLSLEAEPACSPWRQVSTDGFGLPTGGEPDEQPYDGEDGFEVLVFEGRLYVGMEADNSLGARLWRTRAGVVAPAGQADWEEVIAGPDGRPWGMEDPSQADHIDSLAEYGGYLYVSSGSSDDPGGARVYRSPTGDPGSWEDAVPTLGPGFGDPGNSNFNDMFAFDGFLCGGTRGETAGAEVWCTADGTAWERKNIPGFGDRVAVIWSSGIFEEAAYLGVEHVRENEAGQPVRTARVYRAQSLAGVPEWEIVFEGDPGSIWAAVLGAVNGSLHIAAPGPEGIRVYRSKTGDAGSWTPAGLPGLDNSRWNTNTVPDGAVVYRETLHLSVRNPLLGFRIWRLSGDQFWEVIGEARHYEPEALAAQLVVFGDSLYAWTTNYHTGQAVLQTRCGETVPGPFASGLLTLAVVVAGFGALLVNRRA